MRKKLLITALVLLVVIGAAGIWAYNYYLVPDPEIEKELDEELGELSPYNGVKMVF